MTPADVLTRARQALADSPLTPLSPYAELEAAAAGHGKALADTLELLDSVTPPPCTFLMWADGAEWVSDGDCVAVVYRHDRKKAEVLALMGKACLRATRMESLAAEVAP